MSASGLLRPAGRKSGRSCRDKAVHEEVIRMVIAYIGEYRFRVKNWSFLIGDREETSVSSAYQKQPEGFVQTEFPVDVTCSGGGSA